jgi:hypothetical protein
MELIPKLVRQLQSVDGPSACQGPSVSEVLRENVVSVGW